MAALSVWILSQVGNEKTSPVVTKSEASTEATFPNVPPVLFKDVKSTSVPEGKEVTGEWTTKEAESGLLLSIDKPTQLHVLPLKQEDSIGAKYVVYGVDTKDFDPTDPESGTLTELAHGTLTSARQDIELKKKSAAFDGALILFTDMPKSGSVTLEEATLVGIPTN